MVKQLSEFVEDGQKGHSTLYDLGRLLYLTVRRLEADGITPYWDAEQHLIKSLLDTRSAASIREALVGALCVYLHIHVNFEPCDFCCWRLLSYLDQLQKLFCPSGELYLVISAAAPYRASSSKGVQSMLDSWPADEVKKRVTFLPLWRKQPSEQ